MNTLIQRAIVRFEADVTVLGRLIEKHLPVESCKYILHILSCKIVRLLRERGLTHNENWMEMLMGTMKGGVRYCPQ
jgi:hypothetical protein